MAPPVTHYDDGLQVASPDFSQKQSIIASNDGAGTDGKEVFHGAYGDGMEVYTGDEKTKGKRICGLSPLVFWLLIVLAVLVVGGAVGGGVGGSLASKNKRYLLARIGLMFVRGQTANCCLRGNSNSDPGAVTNANTQLAAGQSTGASSQTPESTSTVSSITSSSTPLTSSSASSTSSQQSSTSSTSSSASPTPTGPQDDANCPSSNGTLITSSTATFTTLCDTNVIGVGRNIDLGSVRASSLQNCVDVCTEWNSNISTANGRKRCVAVSWAVNIPGVSTAGRSDYKACYYKWATSLQQYTPDLTEGLGSVSAVVV